MFNESIWSSFIVIGTQVEKKKQNGKKKDWLDTFFVYRHYQFEFVEIEASLIVFAQIVTVIWIATILYLVYQLRSLNLIALHSLNSVSDWFGTMMFLIHVSFFLMLLLLLPDPLSEFPNPEQTTQVKNKTHVNPLYIHHQLNPCESPTWSLLITNLIPGTMMV